MQGGAHGHTLLYRAGGDSRIDRWNIALLKRIVAKSTTETYLEIYYHEPTKLLDWAEGQERVRYVRLRSGESFPFAERIAKAATESVVVFDSSLLIAARDIWQLMALSERKAAIALTAHRARRNPSEKSSAYLWRSARLALKNYLYREGEANAQAFAIHRSLLRSAENITASSFQEKVSYYNYLRAAAPLKPEMILGESFALATEGIPLLGTGSRTIEAFRIWKRKKEFPAWFSGRHLMFHVAQLASYYGALVSFLSPKAGLLVFLFAAFITPQFFFQRLPWRRPLRLPAILGARFLLYFVG